jgi:hypothetical protein
MKFDFSNVRLDGRLETHWDALLRVVGFLAILIGSRRWYEEEDFCLVEFANVLAIWLEQLDKENPDFLYASLESAEPELLHFAHIGGGQWKLGSAHENFREERTLSTSELRTAAEDFLRTLAKFLPQPAAVVALLAEKEEHRQLVRWLREDA